MKGLARISLALFTGPLGDHCTKWESRCKGDYIQMTDVRNIFCNILKIIIFYEIKQKNTKY